MRNINLSQNSILARFTAICGSPRPYRLTTRVLRYQQVVPDDKGSRLSAGRAGRQRFYLGFYALGKLCRTSITVSITICTRNKTRHHGTWTPSLERPPLRQCVALMRCWDQVWRQVHNIVHPVTSSTLRTARKWLRIYGTVDDPVGHTHVRTHAHTHT